MKRKICIINPNNTKAMTHKIDLTAKKFASVDSEIISVEPNVGPESIEGFYDEAFCIPGLIEEIKKNDDADAYISACFDDTGLEVVRSITEKPVIGIGEAAYHVATMVSGNFTVITTLSRSIRPLTHNLKKYGWQKEHLPNQTGSENSYHPKKYNNVTKKKYKSWKS